MFNHTTNIVFTSSRKCCYRPVDRVQESRSKATMAGLKHIAAASFCVLVVLLAMVTESASAAGVCNPNTLLPCLSAIEGARPPPPSARCCNVVRAADKTCMCNQLKSSSFPAQMVQNGLQLPKKCGRGDLRGFKCGREFFSACDDFVFFLSWHDNNSVDVVSYISHCWHSICAGYTFPY